MIVARCLFWRVYFSVAAVATGRPAKTNSDPSPPLFWRVTDAAASTETSRGPLAITLNLRSSTDGLSEIFGSELAIS